MTAIRSCAARLFGGYDSKASGSSESRRRAPLRGRAAAPLWVPVRRDSGLRGATARRRRGRRARLSGLPVRRSRRFRVAARKGRRRRKGRRPARALLGAAVRPPARPLRVAPSRSESLRVAPSRSESLALCRGRLLPSPPSGALRDHSRGSFVAGIIRPPPPGQGGGVDRDRFRDFSGPSARVPSGAVGDSEPPPVPPPPPEKGLLVLAVRVPSPRAGCRLPTRSPSGSGQRDGGA